MLVALYTFLIIRRGRTCLSFGIIHKHFGFNKSVLKLFLLSIKPFLISRLRPPTRLQTQNTHITTSVLILFLLSIKPFLVSRLRPPTRLRTQNTHITTSVIITDISNLTHITTSVIITDISNLNVIVPPRVLYVLHVK